MNWLNDRESWQKFLGSTTGYERMALTGEESPKEIAKLEKDSPLLHAYRLYYESKARAAENRWKGRKWSPKRIREYFLEFHYANPHRPVRELSAMIENKLRLEGDDTLSAVTIRRHTKELRKNLGQ